MNRRVGVLAAVAALAATGVLSAQAAPTSGFFSFSLDLRSGTFAPAPAGSSTTDVSYRGTTVVVDGKSIVLPHPVNAVAPSPDGRFVVAETYDASVCGHKPPPPCGAFALWLMNRDASDLHLLSAAARDAAWSRDSRRLAFVGNFDTATLSGLITVADVDGTDRRALGPREVAGRPTWSADGTLLAYTRADRDSVRVVRVADRRRLAVLARAQAPTWAGAGRRLAFVRHGEALALWRKGSVRVLANAAGMATLAWSPDGRRIAFGRDGTAPAVGVVPVAGGRARLFRLPGLTGAEVTTLAWQSSNDLLVGGLVPPWSPP